MCVCVCVCDGFAAHKGPFHALVAVAGAPAGARAVAFVRRSPVLDREPLDPESLTYCASTPMLLHNYI